jgi:hypothetical protein
MILTRGPKVFVNLIIRIILSQNILAIHASRKSKCKVLFFFAIMMSYIKISSGVSAISDEVTACFLKSSNIYSQAAINAQITKSNKS